MEVHPQRLGGSPLCLPHPGERPGSRGDRPGGGWSGCSLEGRTAGMVDPVDCHLPGLGCGGFNTAVEKLVDFVSPEKQQFARICKDVSAAAVLITVLTAVVIGLVIFGPRLVRMVMMIKEFFTG